MPALYNCRHSGDQYRISKFSIPDFNVESSYLCDATGCDCPAGHRPTCRHREMLPKFLAREAVGTEWLFDYDRGGWVQSGIEVEPPLAAAGRNHSSPSEPTGPTSLPLPSPTATIPSANIRRRV